MTEISSGLTYMLVDPKSLRVEPPFSTLFPITPAIKASIVGSMREHGYDPSKPVNVWKGHNLLIDGHTRREAAIECEAATIPVCYHEFADEDEALKYAIANQRDRRNLTDVDLLRLIEAVDAREKRGGDRKSEAEKSKASHDAFDRRDKSAAQTARIVGTSPRKVEKARVVLDEAKTNPTVKEEILSGKKTINMGSRQVLASRRKVSEPRVIPPSTSQFTPALPPHRISNDFTISEEDEAWLSTFPLRLRVVSHRFDAEALLYRLLTTKFAGLKQEVVDLIGVRSPAGIGHLQKALWRSLGASPVEFWVVCGKCNGVGVSGGPCSRCLGGGFLIPGL